MTRRLVPVTFYRCHDCNWRRAKLRLGWKSVSAHVLSLIGYGAAIGFAVAVVAALFVLTMTLLGIPLPWSHG